MDFWAGLLLSSNEEEKFSICSDLIGKRLSAIATETNNVYIACMDSVYLLTLDNQLTKVAEFPCKAISCGKGFVVAARDDGQLYSWGTQGETGQLGHGAHHRKVFEALEISYKANIASIACGEAHTICLDADGKAHAWGENFDRQLNIYRKQKAQMSIANSLVEELVFNPRLIPWTMSVPLQKIACGKRFTVVITKDGRAFSWGAGESGQLGTGRCTRKDLPSELPFERPLLDIACGDGHAVAVDSEYNMYSWGLNHRGQCGTEDIQARYAPTLTHSDASQLKVFAEGHSSASIDKKGALYTWGSTTHGRLLQPELTKEKPHEEAPDLPFVSPKRREVLLALTRPTRVHSPLNDGVEDIQFETFAFGKARSVALLRTKLTHIWPTKGPKRTFSALRIHGSGLWEAANIIVKFTSHIYSIYNPPRSVLGKLVDRSAILCKPPKFAELGQYTVSVSMDGGKIFLLDTFDVQIYKEVSVAQQLPSILDLRRPFIDLLSIKVHGANVLNKPDLRNNSNNSEDNNSSGSQEERRTIAVKLNLHKLQPDELVSPSRYLPTTPHHQQQQHQHHHHHGHLEILCRGTIVSESSMPGNANSTARANDSSLEETAGSRPMTGVSMKSSEHPSECEFLIECRHISLAELALPAGLYELTTSVAFNDQDFAGTGHSHGHAKSSDVDVSTLCHTFEVIEAIPSCYAISELRNVTALLNEIREQQLHPSDSGSSSEPVVELNPHRYDRKVVISAQSVIPQHRLPKGAHIKVIASKAVVKSLATGGEAQGEGEEKSTESLDEILVHCDSNSTLHFTMTSSFLHAMDGWIAEQGVDPANSMITLHWLFYLELAQEHKKLLLSDKPLLYIFYPEASLTALPLAIRRAATDESHAAVPNILMLTAANLRFQPNSAMVRFHLPGVSEPVMIDQNQLAVSETINLMASPPPTESESEGIRTSRAAPTYKVEFLMPSYESLQSRLPTLPAVDATSSPRPGKLDNLQISLSLDGVKVPSEDCWTKLYFFTSLAKFAFQPPLPKGGAPAGAAVGLLLEDYCPAMPGIVVRLRGADAATAHNVAAIRAETVNPTTSLPAMLVSFTMPDAADLVHNPPVVQGKEKLYFVDVSVDGGLTFDQAAAPQLPVKH